MWDLKFLSDEELVSFFQQGKEQCFDEISNRYYSKLYGSALKMLEDPEDAQEITNNVLLLTYRKLYKFRGDATLSTWLYRILQNQVLNHYRFKRRKNNLPLQNINLSNIDYNSKVTPAVTDCERLPENLFMDQELTETIALAISDLPESMQQTASLYFIDEEPLGVIAEKQSCSIGAIRSRIFRIKKLLKINLEKLN